MAERAHEVPAKYGEVNELFHPRMRSYGRRIEAALPGTIVLLAALAFILYKRPALPYTILVLLIGTIAGVNLYSVLKPTIIVITKTHVLRTHLRLVRRTPRKHRPHHLRRKALPQKSLRPETQNRRRPPTLPQLPRHVGRRQRRQTAHAHRRPRLGRQNHARSLLQTLRPNHHL